jgi:hypothetical protein
MSSGTKIGGAKTRTRDSRLHTYTRRNSIPRELDVDDPVVMAMVTTVAIKLGRTCKISGR